MPLLLVLYSLQLWLLPFQWDSGMDRDFRLGPWTVQPRLLCLSQAGQHTQVEPKMMQVLVCLAERAGEVVSKEELIQAVWPETFVSDDVLLRCISELRKVLGDDAHEPRYIQTIPKSGYRLLARVERLDGRTPAGAWHARKFHPWSLVVVAAATILLAVVGHFLWQRLHPQVATEKVMLAVLPFENLSGDPEQEYFSDGLTEEMITELGRLVPARLGVIARTSAMHFKDSDKTVDEIGRELGVDYLLEGSVRREGGRIRITAQLIRVGDQTHLWAERYDRDLAGILSIQGEVARAIAREVRLMLTAEEETQLSAARLIDPEAYEAYLKGRYFWNKRSREGLEKGLEYFQQAIEIDPGYAVPYAGLADSYILLGNYDVLSRREVKPKAKAAALKALELDDTLAEAHTSLAGVKDDYEWDWSGAEREYKRAIELNPNYATAHHWYGGYLDAMGRLDEAIAERKRARELDPLSLIISRGLARTLHYAGQYDQAIEQCQKILEMDPNFRMARTLLGQAYVQKGMYEEALAEFEKAADLAGRRAGWNLAHAYAVAGKRNEALRIVNELKEDKGTYIVSPARIALVYTGLGEKTQALGWLERAIEERAGGLVLLNVEPRFDSLRSDPRFQALLRRMNFPE